ncbi:MAG: hypothetical protein LBU88_11080 [Treponema sp.]|jgi:hypothetical protein|nr:hypothetical protein [Treponema sp.]
MKKTYIILIFSVFILACLIFTQKITTDYPTLKYGVYFRENSSSIGYVVIHGNFLGDGQNIIARKGNGELIDRGVIRFRNNIGIINLKESSRNASWINKTTFTTDEGNVTWQWVRNVETKDIRFIK